MFSSSRILLLPSCAYRARLFSTSARIQENCAIIYSQNGPACGPREGPHHPQSRHPSLANRQRALRLVADPINPAEVNVIEGVSQGACSEAATKGSQKSGASAMACRTSSAATGCVMQASQVGTWRSAANLREDHLLKVPGPRGTVGGECGDDDSACPFPVYLTRRPHS